jgi:hypothetical protein
MKEIIDPIISASSRLVEIPVDAMKPSDFASIYANRDWYLMLLDYVKSRIQIPAEKTAPKEIFETTRVWILQCFMVRRPRVYSPTHPNGTRQPVASSALLIPTVTVISGKSLPGFRIMKEYLSCEIMMRRAGVYHSDELVNIFLAVSPQKHCSIHTRVGAVFSDGIWMQELTQSRSIKYQSLLAYNMEAKSEGFMASTGISTSREEAGRIGSIISFIEPSNRLSATLSSMLLT